MTGRAGCPSSLGVHCRRTARSGRVGEGKRGNRDLSLSEVRIGGYHWNEGELEAAASLCWLNYPW